MEAELKFTYKKGFTYFDIIESPFIANNLLQSSITSYAMRSSYFDTSDEFLENVGQCSVLDVKMNVIILH